ncbi:GNAT family N-acetyltransferase [Bradyrhizobium sp. WYCCWR 13023]|uniref:GNAT family N-acetyltransferase n=2 Tax=Bradyrhizobium zhengyangense TaxID=2911009 RepID=A0A9X1RBM5_9BRAD|nr:GNAT family N-acetyltransferase [Bradyrhizobium zhengyangense]MCG2628595.1 GNAT family N-acetyltransferase [Bradyrhizobium zhengyangense]MCG2644127.1 GNAT family N-acetyltransferase [Bradyrhizobium zhengyangense]
MIRLLTPADAALYRAIRLEALEAHPEAFASTFAREQEKPLAWFEERLTASDIFGAFIDGELVGIAGFHRQDGPQTMHKAHLWGMYVRQQAGRAGVGRHLVDTVIAHAAKHVEKLQLSVMSKNEAALRLYKTTGFVEYGREVKAFKQNGQYFDEVLMELFLDGSNK